MREYGVLFPKLKSHISKVVCKKTYSFDDVVTTSHPIYKSGYWSHRRRMVSHREALRLDAIIKNVILKYF